MTEFELKIGSVLLIGDSVVTIVDIEDDEVIFKVDEEGSEQLSDAAPQECLGVRRELVGGPTPR